MISENQQFYNILTSFNHLSFETRLKVLQELIANLEKVPSVAKPTNSLLALAGTGKGIYGNVETYLANERNWD